MVLRNPKSCRPWQHVFDVLLGYLILGFKLSTKTNNFSGSYNFGPKVKKNYTVLQLTQSFLDKLIEKKCKIKFIKNKFNESRYLNINSNKSRKKLNWKTYYAGSKMIEKTINWYKTFIIKPKKIGQFSKEQISDYFSSL